MKRPRIHILLSSYNGERFIAEQINSIRNQTHSDWTLLVRDDGSSDATVEIVKSLALLDDRIVLLADRRGNLGPPASFGVLLEQAAEQQADYVALADQDDVWLPVKLARELELLQLQEGEFGRSLPLLVHTDLVVVRDDLSLVHPSFLAFQGLGQVPDHALGTLLIQNVVTGCTAMVNRALLQAAIPLPAVIMHDWWLALCAAALGRIVYLPEAMVHYRQHGGNAQGSRGWRAAVLSALRQPAAWWLDAGALLDQAVEQARELTQRVERESGNGGDASSLQALREFSAAFATGGSLDRLRAIYRHRIRPRSLLRYPLPFYLRVLLWSRQFRGSGMLARRERNTERRTNRQPASSETTAGETGRR